MLLLYPQGPQQSPVVTLPANRNVYTRGLEETATYWAPLLPDGLGNVGFSPPVSIKVRWQDSIVLTKDSSGNDVSYDATVFVDRRVELGGYLLLGITTWPSPLDVNAKEVRNITISPSLSSDEELVKAWL